MVHRSWLLPPNWLGFLIIILIALGVFLRFSNLDLKVYWVDEVINTHYSSGYREIEIGAQVKAWNGRDISIQELHKYQSPNSEKNSIDVIKALAIEEPQSPPLYYLLLRWWMQLFGDSVTVRRSLSAFPCLYWLCWELFRSSLTGWIAMAFLAVSPFHLIYAQEVRYYAAWTVLILFSSAVFLWAIRHIFLYNPSDELREKIETEQDLKTDLLHEGKRHSLWKLNENDRDFIL